MKAFKPAVFYPAVACCLLLWCGCHFTSKTTSAPALNGNEKRIADSINSKYHFENIQLEETKSNGTDGKRTTLTITFTNGKNIPGDGGHRTPFAKQLALAILQSVKDSTKFDDIAVNLGTSHSTGILTATNFDDYLFSRTELHEK